MDNFQRLMLIILFVGGSVAANARGIEVTVVIMLIAVTLVLAAIADRLKEIAQELKRRNER